MSKVSNGSNVLMKFHSNNALDGRTGFNGLPLLEIVVSPKVDCFVVFLLLPRFYCSLGFQMSQRADICRNKAVSIGF